MAHAFKLRISLCLLPCLYCLSLFSLFLNWRNVLNFLHGPCLWVESITNLLSVCVLSCFIVSWLLSLLKLEECIKLLSWAHAFEPRVSTKCCSAFTVACSSSLLKLEECYQTSLMARAFELRVLPYQLLSASTALSLFPLFLNWKNILNFFYGPCFQVKSIN